MAARLKRLRESVSICPFHSNIQGFAATVRACPLQWRWRRDFESHSKVTRQHGLCCVVASAFKADDSDGMRFRRSCSTTRPKLLVWQRFHPARFPGLISAPKGRSPLYRSKCEQNGLSWKMGLFKKPLKSVYSLTNPSSAHALFTSIDGRVGVLRWFSLGERGEEKGKIMDRLPGPEVSNSFVLSERESKKDRDCLFGPLSQLGILSHTPRSFLLSGLVWPINGSGAEPVSRTACWL